MKKPFTLVVKFLNAADAAKGISFLEGMGLVPFAYGVLLLDDQTLRVRLCSRIAIGKFVNRLLDIGCEIKV